VAVGKTHRLADRKEVHVPDLRREKILLLKERQFASIFPLVAAGLGIALVPKMAAPREVKWF
jgi:DNA-binding transcriptional LysR family regulator